jgi:F-type H+-transporting ATPase subunit epsilon
MPSLLVEIVTPEAALWAGEATALMARSSEGEFAVLPLHTPTVGDIVPGVVRVESPEGNVAFAVHGGYFQVGPGEAAGETRATVLAGVAERTTEINVARAEAAKALAEATLSDSRGDTEDAPARAVAEAALARAELRLSAAERPAP